MNRLVQCWGNSRLLAKHATLEIDGAGSRSACCSLAWRSRFVCPLVSGPSGYGPGGDPTSDSFKRFLDNRYHHQSITFANLPKRG